MSAQVTRSARTFNFILNKFNHTNSTVMVVRAFGSHQERERKPKGRRGATQRPPPVRPSGGRVPSAQRSARRHRLEAPKRGKRAWKHVVRQQAHATKRYRPTANAKRAAGWSVRNTAAAPKWSSRDRTCVDLPEPDDARASTTVRAQHTLLCGHYQLHLGTAGSQRCASVVLRMWGMIPRWVPLL